ncbi:MAG: winged helix-turn-helix transcriptional regulator [Kiritimatiellae bacterium]|nr:winged helix-turn-helix transcriptional regulator [Kiritimatiellia bacterium]
MITNDKLQELFASAETYRIERTVSTTDKDKFGEAVCAFANDMPDSGKPGYLLIGVRNDGTLNGLKATDELLQKFAALRSDGNILPIPSIAVESLCFPNVSDYRNPIIAEAMKVIGYVNCYNRGINMVQDELEANGNGKAEFSFRLITTFEAKVALAGKGAAETSETESTNSGMGDKVNEKVNETPNAATGSSQGTVEKTVEKILSAMKGNPSITQQQLAKTTGLSRRGVEWQLNQLKAKGFICRVGPDKGGHWEVLA